MFRQNINADSEAFDLDTKRAALLRNYKELDILADKHIGARDIMGLPVNHFEIFELYHLVDDMHRLIETIKKGNFIIGDVASKKMELFKKETSELIENILKWFPKEQKGNAQLLINYISNNLNDSKDYINDLMLADRFLKRYVITYGPHETFPSFKPTAHLS